MPDRLLIERIAADLGTSPGMVEKDWHVVRALAVIGEVDATGMVPAFSGGTSLSKGWGLIKRFSEDIDFKVAEPAGTGTAHARRERTAYRERVITALTASGFETVGEVKAGNASRFFSVDMAYAGEFAGSLGLRPHIRVEMSFQASALPPTGRAIRSMVAEAQKEGPEIAGLLCIDPVETAADKLSALAWRVRVRQRGSARDDPTIIRHLHDLAALEASVGSAENFPELVNAALYEDIGRGGENEAPTDPAVIFGAMLRRLESDPLWAREYEDFVQAVSFAPTAELIPYGEALDRAKRLIAAVSGRR